MKIYNEVGIGNRWLLSYEVEYMDKEERYKGWYRGKIDRLYFRYWVGRRVMIIDRKGIRIVKKGKFMFKVIVGFEMI